MSSVVSPGLRLECPVCDYKNVFINADGLEKHLALHFKCHPYACGNCRDRARFHSEQAVRTHYEQDHDPAETPFKVNFEANKEDLLNMEKVRLQLDMAVRKAAAAMLPREGHAGEASREQDTHEVIYARCSREQRGAAVQPEQQVWEGGSPAGQRVISACFRTQQPFLAPAPPSLPAVKVKQERWHSVDHAASSGEIPADEGGHKAKDQCARAPFKKKEQQEPPQQSGNGKEANQCAGGKERAYTGRRGAGYGCNICGKSGISTKTLAIQHVNNCHLKTPTFECRFCGKAFYELYASNSFMHVYQVHSHKIDTDAERCQLIARHLRQLLTNRKLRDKVEEYLIKPANARGRRN